MGKYIPVEPEKWAEMVKALAENARLKAEVENSNRINTELLLLSNQQASEVRRLKAEVERLRKAGDAMANAIKWLPQTISDHHQQAWNAAKEGKPSA